MKKMKKMKKLALLLLAVAAGNSARAQVLTLEPYKTYTLTNVSAADGSSISYQWFRNDQPIAGATGASYTLSASDAWGLYVEFRRGAKTPSCPEYSFSNSIIISFCALLVTTGNATRCWAHNNVDNSQTFAIRPDMYTKLHQWANSLCPSGWRLPENADFTALDNLGSTWAAAYARGNNVSGRFFGPNSATCSLPNNMAGCLFLPACGSGPSQSPTTIITQGSNGNYYGSETSSGSSTTNTMSFNISSTTVGSNNGKTSAYAIRCVLN